MQEGLRLPCDMAAGLPEPDADPETKEESDGNEANKDIEPPLQPAQRMDMTAKDAVATQKHRLHAENASAKRRKTPRKCMTVPVDPGNLEN